MKCETANGRRPRLGEAGERLSAAVDPTAALSGDVR